MQIDAVVINASPLITLFRSGQADLLPQLFKRIVVPQAVWQEVVQDDWAEHKEIKNFLTSFPKRSKEIYSTVTLLARFLGLSTSVPRAQAVW